MKVKVVDILNANEGLKKIASLPINIKVSYQLMRLGNKISDELKVFDDKRKELLNKYGEINEGNWKVKEENMTDFTKDINDILEEDVDIEFEPISLDNLGDVKISLADLNLLKAFIK